MVHLLVAELLLEKMKDENIFAYIDERLFIAGNICPDGIMARKGYRRYMKLHSHFRDGIPDGSFDMPGMLPIFHKRMYEFWREHRPDEEKMPGLYLGYITHMMTDEAFVLEERPRFFEEISRIGLTKWDKETFVYFNRETDLVDFELIRRYNCLQHSRKILDEIAPYEIKGMIAQEELTDSRQWILKHFFEEQHPEELPVFLRVETMETFAGSVASRIHGRLLCEPYLTGEKNSR